MNNISKAQIAAVRLITDSLTSAELASMYNCVTAGFDPTQSAWYEKARALFTEDGGTKVHAATLEALDSIVWRRLEPEIKK